MTNMNFTFLAKGVRKAKEQNLEVTENIEVLFLSIEDVKKLLESSQIIEGIQQAPLWRYIVENKI